MHNILKTGSYLWKLAMMNGWSSAHYDIMHDKMHLQFVKHIKMHAPWSGRSSSFSCCTIWGCTDIHRLVSTQVDISFTLDSASDPDAFSNSRIFNLLADIAVSKCNIMAAEKLLWPKGMSKEEMCIRLDLWDENVMRNG